ncbi:YbbR-like domain-containing protein [Snuella sp. CAU 1569]|uniref:YbbR-like domain-containing protein n=1 Tax=Snuella sedimenti TaxID=2798802 RepID=A0A8J7LNT7_9FLAO|nr:YbbR-like domain-containing protein [Snuella sedimenti]
MKKVKSELLKSLESKKINVFVLFLLLSFMILIFTKLSKQYTNTITFSINKINVPKEIVIINDSSIVLNLTLKTHGFRWLNYYISKPEIEIDFASDIYKRDSVFIWSKSKAYLNNTQFDKNVELLNMSPDTLKFKYDVNLVKKVPVKLNADVDFTPGYNIATEFKLEPDSVQIIGPNVLVSQIDFLETEPLSLTEVRTDISKNIKLKLPDNNKELKFSNTGVTLKGHVEKFTEGTLKIPVEITNVPDQIKLKYFPKSVNVTYYVSLSNFSEIKLKDFKVICDYNKIKDNQTFLIPELNKVPKLVKSAKINQQHIEFIITE